MTEIRIVLFDADGVLVTPPKLFSEQYAERNGLDPASLQPFFLGEFTEATMGKADLKELISKHNDLWHWDGDSQGLLDEWFEAENVIDGELLKVVRETRQSGLPVYLATNQEAYRARYFREVMFPDEFDGMFVSSEIGYLKKHTEYWVEVLRQLQNHWQELEPGQVVYFDDSQDSIEGAKQEGISAHLYEGVNQVRSILKPSPQF